MKNLALYLLVGLTTFVAGLGSVTILNHPLHIHRILSKQVICKPVLMPPTIPKDLPKLGMFESKVVQIAEGFIMKEGYTDIMAPHTGPVYYEPGEYGISYGALEARRRDTLERKAYAVYRWKSGKRAFWTVVFPYTRRLGPNFQGLGRAVTMEEDRYNFVREVHVEGDPVRLTEIKKNL